MCRVEFVGESMSSIAPVLFSRSSLCYFCVCVDRCSNFCPWFACLQSVQRSRSVAAPECCSRVVWSCHSWLHAGWNFGLSISNFKSLKRKTKINCKKKAMNITNQYRSQRSDENSFKRGLFLLKLSFPHRAKGDFLLEKMKNRNDVNLIAPFEPCLDSDVLIDLLQWSTCKSRTLEP